MKVVHQPEAQSSSSGKELKTRTALGLQSFRELPIEQINCTPLHWQARFQGESDSWGHIPAPSLTVTPRPGQVGGTSSKGTQGSRAKEAD